MLSTWQIMKLVLAMFIKWLVARPGAIWARLLNSLNSLSIHRPTLGGLMRHPRIVFGLVFLTLVLVGLVEGVLIYRRLAPVIMPNLPALASRAPQFIVGAAILCVLAMIALMLVLIGRLLGWGGWLQAFWMANVRPQITRRRVVVAFAVLLAVILATAAGIFFGVFAKNNSDLSWSGKFLETSRIFLTMVVGLTAAVLLARFVGPRFWRTLRSAARTITTWRLSRLVLIDFLLLLIAVLVVTEGWGLVRLVPSLVNMPLILATLLWISLFVTATRLILSLNWMWLIIAGWVVGIIFLILSPTLTPWLLRHQAANSWLYAFLTRTPLLIAWWAAAGLTFRITLNRSRKVSWLMVASIVAVLIVSRKLWLPTITAYYATVSTVTLLAAVALWSLWRWLFQHNSSAPQNAVGRWVTYRKDAVTWVTRIHRTNIDPEVIDYVLEGGELMMRGNLTFISPFRAQLMLTFGHARRPTV